MLFNTSQPSRRTTNVIQIRKRETTLSETNIRKKYNRWFEQLRHNWSMLIQIWFLLPEHHDFLNSAMPCPGPRPIQILTEFLSWNNHCPRAINHKGKKVTCHYFTHPFSHLPTVEKGVENHTLFYLSPHLFHIYTLSIFSLTLPWPPPSWLSLLLYINEFKLETSCSFYFFQI